MLQLRVLLDKARCAPAWCHWCVLYLLFLLYFLIQRASNLTRLMNKFASDAERTTGLQISALLLGMLEDFIVITFMAVVFLLLELLFRIVGHWVLHLPFVMHKLTVIRILTFVGHLLRFLLVMSVMAIAIIPFAVDKVLLEANDMRFTWDLVRMYQRDKNNAGTFKVNPSTISATNQMIVVTALVCVSYGLVYVLLIDLTLWFITSQDRGTYHDEEDGDEVVVLESDPYALTTNSHQPTPGTTQFHPMDVSIDSPEDTRKGRAKSKSILLVDNHHLSLDGRPYTLCQRPTRRTCIMMGILLAVVIIVPIMTISITHAVTNLLASLALNTTLNEFLCGIFNVKLEPVMAGAGELDTSHGNPFIHPTENYTLLGEKNELYRQTTGFTGDLAFNITVDPKDPPNVLILMVESFRARDSLYLAGHTNAAAKLKEHNLTITPQFDKWAKRGIAFSNLWSSFQTSRSLESVLWAQLPYDKLESSATVGGRTNVKLAGLPQFFTQKGYDVMFSAGSRINYDDWETFLPSHGFDTIVSSNDYKKMAQQTMNLTENDWDNGNSHRKRDMYWGVHDDISFQLLGDTLIKKLGEQKARVAKGELKKPFFIDHYTISSHMIWDGMPQWYVDQLEQTKELLPYLALAEGEFSYLIQCYHKLRYFTDQELGKFLTRMEKEGVLKDTIIIITGDHGHSPEMGYSGNEANQEATTHVAGMLLAEGHMDEKDKGTMMNDAVAHYDILNTLADIVGVPEGGFPQNGIGRSLKRAVPFGERLVYSNNPLRKLSIVKGDKRFVYDRATVTNAVLLHDVIQDTELKNDLFPSIDAEAQKKWMALRDTGRMLNDYYTNKWNTGCMAEAPCPK